MAGFAYGFDDGGAIPDDQGSYPTDTGDNSGAPPVYQQPADNSGATPVVPLQEPEQPDSMGYTAKHPWYKDQSGMLWPRAAGALGREAVRAAQDLSPAGDLPAGKRIIQYLLGADAAHPGAAEKFKQGAKVEHPELSDDDANLVAVLKAQQQGGDEAAHQMLQYNRVAYNYKQGVAKNLINSEVPDFQGAADAATEASKHVLDGSTTRFVASPNGGVTATVKGLNGQAQNYNLTPQQFAQYADLGGDGQWDKLIATGGVPAALERIASSNAAPNVNAQSRAPNTNAKNKDDRGTQAPDDGSAHDPTGGDTAGFDEQPGSMTPDIDPQLLKRANYYFPSVSQARQRAAWLSQQESQQAGLKNTLDVAKTRADALEEMWRTRATSNENVANVKAKSSENVANIRSEGYAKAQQQKAQLALQKMAQQARDANERNRINVATRLINNPNWATQSADERNAILKNYGLDQLTEPSAPGSTPPAATPGVGPLPGQNAQGKPMTQVPRLKLPDGKYYVKGPDGKAMLDQNQQP